MPEPRIGSQAGSIDSLIDDEEVKQGAEIVTSTEPAEPARATRQIFDYDQLPESRIKAKEAAEGEVEDEDELDYEIGEDDDDEQEEGLEQEEEIATAADSLEDNEHNLLKRIDKFVDDVDDGDDDLDDLIEDLSPGADDDEDDLEEDEERKQHK